MFKTSFNRSLKFVYMRLMSKVLMETSPHCRSMIAFVPLLDVWKKGSDTATAIVVGRILRQPHELCHWCSPQLGYTFN